MSALETQIGNSFIDAKGRAVSLDQILAKKPEVIGVLFTAAW